MTTALLLAWQLTAYAPGCGATGLTRAGTRPVAGHTIAADPRVLPLGSLVEIEGLGLRQVHDTGRLIRGRRIDLFVTSCAEAREWGRQHRRVRILHVAERRAYRERQSLANGGRPGGRLPPTEALPAGAAGSEPTAPVHVNER